MKTAENTKMKNMIKRIEAIEKDMFISFYETIRWIRASGDLDKKDTQNTHNSIIEAFDKLGDSLKETNKMRINAKKLQV